MRYTMDSGRVAACVYTPEGELKEGPWYGILYLEHESATGRYCATLYEDPGAAKKLARQAKLLAPAAGPAVKIAGKSALVLGAGLLQNAFRLPSANGGTVYLAKKASETISEDKREMDRRLLDARAKERGLKGAKKVLTIENFSGQDVDVVREKGQDALLIREADHSRIVGFVPDRRGKLVKNRLTARWKGFIGN